MVKMHLTERKLIHRVLASENGERVLIAGFLKRKRILGKKLVFGLIQDSTEEIQAVFSLSDIGQENLDTIAGMPLQSVCAVEGTLQKNTGPTKKSELLVSAFKALSISEPQLPIDLGPGTETGMDLRLNWRFLDLRDERQRTIMLMCSDFERFSRDFFYREGLREIHSPKIMGTASESGAEVFTVNYFDTKAYLAQSPQFYKQMAIAAGFDRVFEIAPAYRAEKSYTNRHLTEFVSLDVELGYIEDVEDVMAFEERWIVDVLDRLKEKWGATVERLFGVEIEIPALPFPRIRMEEAIEKVNRSGMSVPKGGDLPSEGERRLGQLIAEERHHPFVFVTHFPFSVRPFYHHKTDPVTSCSYDLLWNGVEITTGAQREHQYEVLKGQLAEKGMKEEPLTDYLNFFRFGCPPHGGFGLGIARFLMALLGLENIREATLLTRDPKRLTP
ncbi:MAG TPA: aspartate--tRNA(Asn) ligase [Thermotogota bacterium]|nr:aspartate--tRNA(Asn) ligase [Thermotogota bacterium]HOM54783.1 aspartate--tRNA(Asn) ligase [Thermotogota bacterium]HOS25713.1 aspartate--tRNA(Asn) ligase [Thermotogota bacterium]HOT87131.1 aspartate--tRNA(Asn) ligase [Thermotogota bacterium]HPD36453.1 aspartate--tRNA(Asn) ligase [Thermotogota bacterium]